MIILVILGLLIGGYLFLIAPRMLRRVDRTPFRGRYYAHRGLFDNETEAPENSLPAFRKAAAAGYGIELDVQLSKDGVPVVFHDASLSRMCGVDGNVWEYTLEELQQFKLAKSEESIPTFAEVLSVIGGQVPIIVEYKLDRVQTEVCALAHQQLSVYPGHYCVESFHPLAVQWYRRNHPEVMRGQLCENYFQNEKHKGKIFWWLLSYLVTNVATRPDFIAFRHSDASNLSRRVCRWMGALSIAWTVRSQEQLEQARPHYDIFIFDSFIPR